MRNIRNTCLLALITGLYVSPAPGMADVLADPTRPYQEGDQRQKSYATGQFRLDTTLVSEDRRVAVINGNHVTEGEAIGNARVVRIGKHTVILQSPEKRIRLDLLPDIVKNTR